MGNRFVAFDVETPNAANNRMSAIGVAVVDNGMIVDRFSSLVNPETHFDPFNIQLTGIAPTMVQKAPTFEELWPLLEPLLSSGLLVAHNAPFDMSVLSKCLRAYCIDWRDTVWYACTCRMTRRCYPKLPNHKLNTLCAYLGISLDHHQADSDSCACAEILIDCLDRGMDINMFRRQYDLIHCRTINH